MIAEVSEAGPFPLGKQHSTKLLGLAEEKPSTGAWKRVFLKQIGIHGSTTRACEAAGITTQRAYQVKAQSPRFAEAWLHRKALARKAMVERAEAELQRRGIDGWEEPVYQMGLKVGTKPKHSDTCLVKLLEANSKRYRKREQTTGNTVNVVVNPIIQGRLLQDPEALRMACELDERLAAPRAIDVTPQASPSPSDA